MCHLVNIALRLGTEAPVDEVRASMSKHEDAANTLTSILEQHKKNNVDLNAKPFLLGPALTYDNQKEQFTGACAEAANKLVHLESRKPFIVPETV